MRPEELRSAWEQARSLADWATGAIREAAATPHQAHTKSSAADWVTETDEAVERHVRAQLQAAFPHHRVVGEEQGAGTGADDAPTWYIDPVDGTANFVHNLPWFSFSLGLVVDGEPMVGVIADPMRHEIMSALRGEGVYLNETRLSVSPPAQIAGTLITTELAGQGAWPGFQAMLGYVAGEHAILRMMGSSALSLAVAGIGRAAGVVLQRYAAWDVAAGVAICREAGLVVRDATGSDTGMPQGSLVGGHPEFVATLWEVLKTHE